MVRKTKKPSQKLKKKRLSNRQQTSLNKHSKHHSAKHMAFMKRRMLMGDTMRQAHKKAMKKTGK